MDPAATGSFIRELIDGGRRDVAEVAEQSRWREKRARRAVAIGVVAALLISIAAGVVAVSSSDTRAEDVAARVAPDVFRQLVAESRAQRIANARGVLTAANDVLADRGLPMVADPGPQANPEQILAAASSAQVLSVLPEDIVQKLRAQLDGRPIMLPSATSPDTLDPGAAATPPPGSAAPDRPSAPGPDGGQLTTPGNPGGTGGGTGPSSPGGNASPGGGDTPAPPPPTRRRLIPQIVPLPIPLIGT